MCHHERNINNSFGYYRTLLIMMDGHTNKQIDCDRIRIICCNTVRVFLQEHLYVTLLCPERNNMLIAVIVFL